MPRGCRHGACHVPSINVWKWSAGGHRTPDGADGDAVLPPSPTFLHMCSSNDDGNCGGRGASAKGFTYVENQPAAGSYFWFAISDWVQDNLASTRLKFRLFYEP